MYKAIFFDLDSTLEIMDEKLFVKEYFSVLEQKCKKHNFDVTLLTNTVSKGLELMFSNNGSKLNRDVFWNNFYLSFKDIDKKLVEDFFNDFYENDFVDVCKTTLKPNPYAREIIDFAKKNFEFVGLTTNPVFPETAVLKRMEISSLFKDDFALITTYDNSSFCKPNPGYFKEILKRYNFNGDEVIMIGNNSYEDCYCATEAGIKTTFLMGDKLLLPNNIKDTFLHVKNEEVINHLKELLNK